HFASYQKTVERTQDARRYRCSIYYDVRWETELLIQVLSFGPMVKVLGPEHFLNQVKERVERQRRL
ncbi:MAG: WYL domain-containing protein, partial [Lachnospiraceae bacterium]|nr:WYL domain-containing protein [Lachnospiraceae bacterium]